MDDKTIKELLKINFNKNAPGRYWYLYLIEKIGYSDKTINVKFKFINTVSPDNFYKGFNQCREFRETIVLPVEFLYYLESGMIYDTEIDEFIKQSEYFNENWNITIDFPALLEKTNVQFPFLDSKYSPLNNDDDLEGLSYYFFDLNSNKVILTDNVLSKYFSFKSTKFISRLITNGINELFDIDNITIAFDEQGIKTGYLKYNNDLLSKNDIKGISYLFFMKNNSGIKYLKSLESNIVSYFINNKDNQEKLRSGVYIDTKYPFNHEISYILQGKRFQVDKDYYFIAEKIVSHIAKTNEIIVDRVELEPMNPNDSTKDRKNKEKEDVNRPGEPIKNQLEITTNISGNPIGNIKENPIKTNNPNGFSIPTFKKKRKSQNKAYNVIKLPNDQEFKGDTAVVQESDNETKAQRNSFFEQINIIKVDKFELMNLVSEKLKKNEVIIENNYLNKSILQENVYDFDGSKVMVLSLCYENKYFYIIDFEKSSGGFIRTNYMTKIAPMTLELFITECLKINIKTDKSKKVDNKNDNNENKDENKGLSFWTKVRLKEKEIFEKHGVIIEMPFDHPRINIKSKNEAAEKISNKIFNDRIKKIVA